MSVMDARSYNDTIMNGLFREVYPAIAEYALEITGVCSGLCIDLGGGPGMLGICIARISDLHVKILDPLADCLLLAEENIAIHGLTGRVTTLLGTAEKLPTGDGEADLIVSRGSIYFWENQRKGLREVYRSLAPGGWAYIGGGFGNQNVRDRIFAEKENDSEWKSGVAERGRRNSASHFRTILTEIGISGEVRTDERGTWVLFQKPR